MRNFLTRSLVAALSLTSVDSSRPHVEGKPLTFDAASVRSHSLRRHPAPAGRQANSGRSHGAGARPTRAGFIYPAIRLRDLIVRAYNLKDYQLAGPNWLNSLDSSTRFTIDATMPPSTTKEQLRVMLQSLLAERFKLVVHHETRELPQYSLVVAKNGPKMKESGPAPPPDPNGGALPGRGHINNTEDAYGFPNWQPDPEGGTWRFMISGRGRIGGARVTMQQLAEELAAYQLKTPVADNTGLKAKYDFLL